MRRIFVLPYLHGLPLQFREELDRKVRWEKLPTLDVLYLEQIGKPLEIYLKDLSCQEQEDVILFFTWAAYHQAFSREGIAQLAARIFMNKKQKFRIVPAENSYSSRLLRKFCELNLELKPIIRARDYRMAKFISQDLMEGENGFITYGFMHDLRGYLKQIDPKISVESLLTYEEIYNFLEKRMEVPRTFIDFYRKLQDL